VIALTWTVFFLVRALLPWPTQTQVVQRVEHVVYLNAETHSESLQVTVAPVPVPAEV